MLTKILEKLLSLFNIPQIAVRYFRLSNKLLGLGKNNFPKELVPLNTKQLSRGMLNYTFFQHYPEWKRPFWAVRQYDPNENSFIPRSHLGVSINVTHRNWTAIGNMDCDVEPIVDPCGSVVPFVDGWSLECWVKCKEQLIYPAYHKNIKQKLVDDLPIVETEIIENDFILKINHYTSLDNLFCEYEITKSNPQQNIELELIIAVRPFNFEGVSPIDSIQYIKDENSFIVNQKNKIYFNFEPDKIIHSNLEFGDSADHIINITNQIRSNRINCKDGFANSIAVFKLDNFDSEKDKIKCLINLNNKTLSQFEDISLDSIKDYWRDITDVGSSFTVPDKKLSSIIKSSLITSLQFIDSNKVTPGAAIYHQFWFRDAAFQLNILDKLGYSRITKKILDTLFSYQKKDGYFQSQKGEWDSNGQVLWMLLEHAMLSNDLSILKDNFSKLYKAVKWIDKNRLTEKKVFSEKYFGLLPKGLSAEHLGLADYYYWDNFWAIAGIKSFMLMCDLVNKSNPKEYAKGLLDEYEKVLNESISNSVKSNQFTVIPSAPFKVLDSGMIGSLNAIYPLQVHDWKNKIFKNSVEYVYKNYFHKNLFFQNIIHSGGNPYITLQIAHSFLYYGKRELFNKIFNDVLDYASPTLNFPEAIHPLTGGGVIGDGHHGWAAAEILSAVKDSFVYEKDYYSLEKIDLVLLSGIDIRLFEDKTEISVKDICLLCGSISLRIKMVDNTIELYIDYNSNKYYYQENFIIVLPYIVKSISSQVKELSISFEENETTVYYKANSMKIIFYI